MGTLTATLMVLTQWTILLVVLMGLGRLFGLVLGLGRSEALRLPTHGWLGIGLATTWLYLIHIVSPLASPAAWLPLLVVGLLGWLPNARRTVRRLTQTVGNPKYIVSASLLVLVAFYLSNQALAEPLRFDSQLYHLAAIEFHAKYEVIEGIANLHDRLAFQTPVFPLAAVAGTGLWSGEGFRIVVGIFVLLGLIELGSRVWGALEVRRLPWGSGLYLIAFSLFIGLDGSTLQPRDFAYSLASPDIDIPAGIILVVAAAYFVDALDTLDPYTIGLAILTGAISATFRPINLVFFVTALACLGLVAGIKNKDLVLNRVVGSSLLLSIAILGTIHFHTLLQSGYPFYPAPYFGIDLPWAVPADEVRDTTEKYIRDFARFTYPQIDPQPFFSWFPEWIRWLATTGALRDMAWLPLTFLLGVAAMFAGRRNFAADSRGTKLAHALAFLPPLLAVGVWFVSAPLPRFGHGALVVLVSLPLSLALSRVDAGQLLSIFRGDRGETGPSGRPSAWLAPASLLLILSFAWIPKVDELSGPVRSGGEGRFGAVLPRKPVLRPYEGGGDWVQWVADESQQCGRELRCAPILDPARRVRFLGSSVEDGFKRYSGHSR